MDPSPRNPTSPCLLRLLRPPCIKNPTLRVCYGTVSAIYDIIYVYHRQIDFIWYWRQGIQGQKTCCCNLKDSFLHCSVNAFYGMSKFYSVKELSTFQCGSPFAFYIVTLGVNFETFSLLLVKIEISTLRAQNVVAFQWVILN